MKIAVCVKQIPDPAAPYELDPETHFVSRPNDQVLDDTDRYGVELGLQLAEASEGTVVLVSMSPAGSLQGIRQALAMGADKAVIVDDESLRGSGALVTAKVLAKAIEAEGDVNLVIAGTESTDGYSGVVPQMMSELLSMPSLTFARKVEVADGTVTIERNSSAGYDVAQAPLPALVSVTAGVVEPRYPTFKGIMQAKSKPIDTPSVADLGLEGSVGAAGSGQTILDVRPAPEREAGTKIVDEGEAYQEIVNLLEQVKVI